jgi:hypothetical protein
MPLDPSNTVMFEGARIIFRNFAGEEGPMNAAGDRNFCVVIADPEIAEQMAADGWNIKQGKESPDGDVRDPSLQGKVSFRNYPPKVYLITSRGRTALSEDEIDVLDYSTFKNVDLIVRPYNWAVGDKVGVKAYLKTMYVTLEEDELDQKYSDVPDADKKHDEE